MVAAEKYKTTILVAGIPVSVSLNDHRVYRLIQHHYRDFLSGSDSKLNIEFDIKEGSNVLDMSAHFEQRIVRFDQIGIRGFIDSDSGKGQFSIAVDRPFEAIDYCIRVGYALLAYQAGGLMVHAAGIMRNQRVYLFVGHSGIGKTTVSRLSQDGIVLNDDLVIVMKNENGWFVSGTPFWNPTQVRPTNISAGLAKILFLKQDTQVYIEEVGRGSALAELVASVPILSGSEYYGSGLLERCVLLLSEIPHHRLHFLPQPSFWQEVLE